MKRTFGLAAVIATLLLVSGCSGLHGKDRPSRDPVRLPRRSCSGRKPHHPSHPRHDRLESRGTAGTVGRVELIS